MNMRSYIITEIERKVIQRYLERGNHLEGYRMLLHRAKKLDLEDLKKQIELIEQFLRKAES